MEWPSLLGPDKLKLLKNLTNHFNNCQPTEIASDVERLWKVTQKLIDKLGIKYL